MWAAPQLEIAELGSDTPVPLDTIVSPEQASPFIQFSGAYKQGLRDSDDLPGVLSALLMNCEVVGLLAPATRRYISCGNPACEGVHEFKPNRESCPHCRGYLTINVTMSSLFLCQKNHLSYVFCFAQRPEGSSPVH